MNVFYCQCKIHTFIEFGFRWYPQIYRQNHAKTQKTFPYPADLGYIFSPAPFIQAAIRELASYESAWDLVWLWLWDKNHLVAKRSKKEVSSTSLTWEVFIDFMVGCRILSSKIIQQIVQNAVGSILSNQKTSSNPAKEQAGDAVKTP